MKTLALAVILASVILAGCVATPLAGTPVPPRPTQPPADTPAPTPTPTPVPPVPDAIVKVRAELAAQWGVTPPTALAVVRWEAVDWPDACLGVQQPGVACAEVITPGYRVIVLYQNVEVEVHTNQDGSAYVVLPGEGVPTPYPAPAWVEELRVKLAAELGVSALRLVGLEAVDWPDSCLGVAGQGKPCLDVITPGYRLLFVGDGKQFEVHTNADGTKYVAVPVPE